MSGASALSFVSRKFRVSATGPAFFWMLFPRRPTVQKTAADGFADDDLHHGDRVGAHRQQFLDQRFDLGRMVGILVCPTFHAPLFKHFLADPDIVPPSPPHRIRRTSRREVRWGT